MKPYNDYSTYLRNKYGTKVYRIGLDAGFTCPNRDGTKGTGGCTYCNADGSRSSYTKAKDSVTKQLFSRIEFLKKKVKAEKFIAYFQAFTNTHAPLPRLKSIYDEILPFKEVVGISIGTRPDAVDNEKLKLVSSYQGRFEVWIEYGLQSIHDRTLKAINRGHDFEDFLTALRLTRKFDIPACAHV
ncbi:MAG: TIGR01212 family radical SAM protein, partial [Deltaproteobacteria bacterium]|nr:TIGR01212 family radical SAM protein [Deltaproteobacteria bacterium]